MSESLNPLCCSWKTPGGEPGSCGGNSLGLAHIRKIAVINPRRACAARVIVVGFVCVSVKSHLTSRMSNRAINVHTWWHMNVKIFVVIFLKRLRSKVMVWFLLTVSAQRTMQHQTLPSDCQQHNIQPCPEQCLLMQSAMLEQDKTSPRVVWFADPHDWWVEAS